ncbi:SGNH/GDSL hydrolase family protein [Ideonella sp. 4Y16]|uniref:SGNH/GDSL hydrolase family protein n=1 Tax=Ideonella alba TaxID=2824118 RepID=UPI001B36F525|nr:SGNH/GDSL hydrolase family protein [Ideonella alba]MBQ0946285.1 SGNH/GDSL hydrolase family protein [Ideonella alba]
MLAKLALGPLLIAQGRQVRRQALRLPEAAGPRSGVAGEGAARWRLLVLGDSSGAGVGVAHQDQALAAPLAAALAARLGGAVAWRLLATTGHTAADALQALREAELAPADLLVTALGVNDAVGQTRPQRFVATLDAIHAEAQARCGVRCTLHSALPPMGRFPLLPQPLRWVMGRDAARLDAALARHVAGRSDRRHVPLPAVPAGPLDGWVAEDGFHPGPRGYPAWAQALAEAGAAVLR